MTDRGLRPIAHQLVHLSLHGCESAGDAAMEGLEKLVSLNVAYTLVGNRGLETLRNGSPYLEILYLAEQRCDRGVQSADIHELLAKHKG